jgi:glycosyltransferase involved in cell wall biosynthesis/2-polyprenyl-3-methyl-5-hydroxy-6-metoxy-1,4-benzoquinol methylase
MNYLLVSHCSFNSNSCIQAYHILEVLVELGWDCVISVPYAPDSIFDVFKIDSLPFKVITYGTNELDGLFDDGRGADVIHAFTPRQHVRNETLRLADYFQSPYVVHMEDNEEEILRTELGIESVEDLIDLPAGHQSEHVGPWRIWPAYYRSFLSNAAGITALIDRLLESNFGHRPALVFWPGFDKRYLNRLDRQGARRRFDLPLEGHLLVYAGVVHDVNVDEVESLLLAVAELNRRGHQVYLVKAGKDSHPLFKELPPAMADMVINLGFVNRVDLPQLLQSADVLVQPGMANPFNDYRFPSKLPEYFATGLPVVLPKTNIGLHVEDGVEALVLHEGHYRETADCIERLITNPGLAQQIGNAGREFALRELTWEKNARKIHNWLIEVLQNQPPPIAEKSFNIDSHQTSDPKLIAFYLPQFHPIPENNQWWGEGFTEWTNVKRGQPNFSGHYQPRLPADLGFYDLRDPEVMDQQAAIAQLYGIYGFCYYYYWFNGKRLLEHPLETMLARNRPDMPFCLCWANENWTRRWDGRDKEILIAQNYDSGWVEQFFKDILPYFQDERYIRVDGRPMLLLYRIEAIPDSTTTIQTWKQMARAAGLGGLHVVGVQYVNMIPEHPIKMGADATVEFPPHLHDSQHSLLDPTTLPGIHPDFSGYIEEYSSLMQQFLNRSPVNIPWYRGVMPGWDNTARRRMQSHVYVNSSPKLYELWLQYLVDYSRCAPNGQPLIFVNAWNEWAEGAYLEPDQKYGWEYLEATSRALRGYTPIHRTRPYQPLVNRPQALAQNQALNSYEMNTYQVISKRRSDIFRAARRSVAGNSPTLAFCDSAFIQKVINLYSNAKVLIPEFSYATVKDYCDSWDNLEPITRLGLGDLKNVQRPWALKAVLAQVPVGSKILEFGGGYPLIAATLARIGYDVTVVDPYDGTGHGPTEYEDYCREFPEVRIIRGYFRPGIAELAGEEGSFDTVYSISVLEHITFSELKNVFAAMGDYLHPQRGLSIHSIDLVVAGNRDAEYRDMLRVLTDLSGIHEQTVADVLHRMEHDIETYRLSAEGHNLWRAGQPYAEFPMRIFVSLQFCTLASRLAEQPTAYELTGKNSEIENFYLKTAGRCPICNSESHDQFVAHHPWLRDYYLCKDCGTCPRQRSMALLLEQLLPSWRQLSIHEGSPCIPYYEKECSQYTCSYYFSHINPGEIDPATGLRCEDFEALTFPDDTFDIFMHQDVLEHVFNPHKAVREAMRVLKPGGLHIFTAPKNKLLSTSEPRAALENGQVNYLKPAEYHIDPKDSEGVLVTWDYGADFDDLLSAWSGYLVNTHIMRDRRYGVDGDYLEVFYCWKTPENKLTSEERVAILKSWPYGTRYLSLL